MLLHHIPSAMSYGDLMTLPDGTQCDTFKETAIQLAIHLAIDEEWDWCLNEASTTFCPYQIWALFVMILVFGEPAKPKDMWEKYRKTMGEDIMWKASNSRDMDICKIPAYSENSVLSLLQDELFELGSCLELFNLPAPNPDSLQCTVPHLIQEEMFDCIEQNAKAKKNIASLNPEQGLVHKLILQCVVENEEKGKLFFINVPGGYGKTFLMETILSSIRGMGKIALAVESSGIAAELLEGGHTGHSWFTIPVPISHESMCSISLQSMHAQLMRSTSLICWDEILMSNKQHIECVDRPLWDILKVDKPFGGITMVFGGNPHQILPIVHHGDHPQIVNACVKFLTAMK